MDIRYMKDMSHNYMIVSAEDGKQPTYQTQMLVSNTIPGLLPVHVRQIDLQLEYYYEITGKQPLEKWLEGRKLGCKEMEGLILALRQTTEQLEKYLLSGRYLLLEPARIYIETEAFQPSFCYYPEWDGELEDSVKKLLQYMLGKVDHERQDAVMLAYGLFQESLKENLSFENLLKVIRHPLPGLERDFEQAEQAGDYWKEGSDGSAKEKDYGSIKGHKESEEYEEEELEDFASEQQRKAEYDKGKKQDRSQNYRSKKKRDRKSQHKNELEYTDDYENRKTQEYRTQEEEYRESYKGEDGDRKGRDGRNSEGAGFRKGAEEEEKGRRPKGEQISESKAKKSGQRTKEDPEKSGKQGKIIGAFWMAVPFLTLIIVVILFSGKIVPMQEIWRQYPGICLAILIFVLVGNFTIVKKWYFEN